MDITIYSVEIGHSLHETYPKIEFEVAKFMFEPCTEFIKYLKSKMKINSAANNDWHKKKRCK